MGSWAAPVMWSRADVRRRWKSLVLLGLLAGVTAAFATASFAGARRTDTALTRLDKATNAANAFVFTSQVGDLHPDWERLASLPEVAQLAVWDLIFCYLDGQPNGVLFASDGDGWLTKVDKPVVLAGRMFNPKADDEAVVNEQVATIDHIGVGDVMQVRTYAPDQLNGGTPHGPKIALRVVGIVRTTEEFLFAPNALVSPGVVAHFRRQAFFVPNAVVRVTGGEAGMSALKRDVSSQLAPGVPVLDLRDASRRVTTSLAVESFALYMIALAVLLAGGLLVAQVLSRSASFIGQDVAALRAIGMTRRDISAAALMSAAPAICVAVVLGLAAALALSPLFPLGMGRQIDPDVGLHADWTALGIGIAITAISLAAGAVLFALSASRRETRQFERQTSAVLSWFARVAPVPVAVGVRMALQRGAGARSLPVRPALVAAVAGVLGVVSALTINSGIRHALANPQLAGVTFSVLITPTSADVRATSVSQRLVTEVQRAAPGASLAVLRRDLVDVDGIGVPTFDVRAVPSTGSPITLAIVAGRPPSAEDEAAIGPDTARSLGVGIGQWVKIGHGERVRLVGEALFPSDVHSEFDEGLWLTVAKFDTVVPPSTALTEDEVLAVRFPSTGNQENRAIADAEADLEGNPITTGPIGRLTMKLGGPGSVLGSSVEPADVPLELANLEDLAQLPTILGAFLAFVALVALSYILFTSGRVRKVEFAVLKTLGLDEKSSRVIIFSQATAISLIGVVAGIPLGLAAARWGWAAVTSRVPLVNVPPVSVLVVILTVPVVSVAGNAVAIWPARKAAHRNPAEALRSE
jgi:ABC-type lipoprotein release transport system permease subunit